MLKFKKFLTLLLFCWSSAYSADAGVLPFAKIVGSASAPLVKIAGGASIPTAAFMKAAMAAKAGATAAAPLLQAAAAVPAVIAPVVAPTVAPAVAVIAPALTVAAKATVAKVVVLKSSAFAIMPIIQGIGPAIIATPVGPIVAGLGALTTIGKAAWDLGAGKFLKSLFKQGSNGPPPPPSVPPTPPNTPGQPQPPTQPNQPSTTPAKWVVTGLAFRTFVNHKHKIESVLSTLKRMVPALKNTSIDNIYHFLKRHVPEGIETLLKQGRTSLFNAIPDNIFNASMDELVGFIIKTITLGTSDPGGKNIMKYMWNTGKIIGVDKFGRPTSWLCVVIDTVKEILVTTYPIHKQ